MTLYTMTIQRQRFTVHADDSVTQHPKLETMTGVPAQLVNAWKADRPDAVILVKEDEKTPDRKRFSGLRDKLSPESKVRVEQKKVQARKEIEQDFDLASPSPSLLGDLINQAVKEMAK